MSDIFNKMCEGWSDASICKSMNDVVDFHKTKWKDVSDEFEETPPILSVTNNGFIHPEDHFEFDQSGEDISNYQIVNRGDFAYNPSRINVGSIARQDIEDVGLISPMYVVFSYDGGNHYYFEELLQSSKMISLFDALSTGSVRQTINKSTFKKIKIPIPDIEEQQNVSGVLCTLNQGIKLTNNSVEKLENIKQGVLHHYFDDYHAIRLDANPDNTNMVELSNLVEFKSGKAWKTANLSEEGMKIVRISNLTGEKDEYWRYDGDYEEKRVIKNGDLLFSWAGMKSSIGVHIYEGETALLNQHIYNLVPSSDIDREYLYYYLDYRMGDLHALSQGGAVQIHLTKDIIERILIPDKPLEERNKIKEKLRQIDKAIQVEKNLVEQLETLKRGLKQDLYSGIVRTRDKDIEIVDKVLADG